MTNYAFDEENRIVFIENAFTKKLYYCLECQEVLKKQTRENNSSYFSHSKINRVCRIANSPKKHQLIQENLQKSYPFLKKEQPFFDLYRIADLVWEDRKLIFEIQSSDLSKKEAQSLIYDYNLKGYEIIWLLDDRFFNQRNLRKSEAFLRQRGYYLSFQNKICYDQFEVILNRRRLFKGPKLLIDLAKPIYQKISSYHSLQQGKSRCLSLFFKGDLFEFLKQEFNYQTLTKLEKRILFQKKRSSLTLYFKKYFSILLEILLRSIAKK